MRTALLVVLVACKSSSPPALPPTVGSDSQKPPPPDSILAIAGAATATCATRASGHVDCWGSWSDDPKRAKRVDHVDDAIAVGLSSTGEERCITRRSGLTCTMLGRESKSVKLPAGVNVDEVSMDARCVRTTAGGIACWDDASAATLVDNASNVAHLVGPFAITTKGEVYLVVPWTRVPDLDHVRVLAGGFQTMSRDRETAHTCATFDDGTTRCFGVAEPDDEPPAIVEDDSIASTSLAAARGATSLVLDGVTLSAVVGGKLVVIDGDKPPVTTPTSVRAIAPHCALSGDAVTCWDDAGSAYAVAGL